MCVFKVVGIGSGNGMVPERGQSWTLNLGWSSSLIDEIHWLNIKYSWSIAHKNKSKIQKCHIHVIIYIYIYINLHCTLMVFSKQISCCKLWYKICHYQIGKLGITNIVYAIPRQLCSMKYIINQNLYVHIYKHIHVYMSPCWYMSIYAYTYICIHIWVCLCIFIDQCCKYKLKLLCTYIPRPDLLKTHWTWSVKYWCSCDLPDANI